MTTKTLNLLFYIVFAFCKIFILPASAQYSFYNAFAKFGVPFFKWDLSADEIKKKNPTIKFTPSGSDDLLFYPPSKSAVVFDFEKNKLISVAIFLNLAPLNLTETEVLTYLITKLGEPTFKTTTGALVQYKWQTSDGSTSIPLLNTEKMIILIENKKLY